MTRIVVTGAAGFIGSHLCEVLLQTESNQVIGIDMLLELTTPRWIKQQNISKLQQTAGFQLLQTNMLQIEWDEILRDVDVVYHLAGMPGVRSSWGTDFVHYANHNVVATQRLLEGCKRNGVKKLIFASTSSVYGDSQGQVEETAPTTPLSPYGISKLTCEHLCRVYGALEAVPIVILRFFTVYGPRQRPDMAFHRFIKQMLDGEAITLYGDGTQSRDFTYIDDCIWAIASVMHAPDLIGKTINIGGKERATVNECVAMLEQLLQTKAAIHSAGRTHGEPKSTWADISSAERLLGYTPTIDLRTGLAREIQYVKKLYV